MDEHALVVNKTVGMAVAGSEGWPTILTKHGYGVYAIEEQVQVGKRTVCPDVITVNKDIGHILAIDCKGGPNIDHDQDLRYSQMSLADLVSATLPPCEARTRTFAYAINEEHAERIRAHTPFPLIVFGRDSIRGSGDLGSEELTRELVQGVPLSGAESPDTAIYPFSVHDDHAHIDGQVASGLEAYLSAHPWMAGEHLINLETANHVLRASHPLYSSLSRSHRSSLANAIKKSLARLDQSGELGRILAMF